MIIQNLHKSSRLISRSILCASCCSAFDSSGDFFKNEVVLPAKACSSKANCHLYYPFLVLSNTTLKKTRHMGFAALDPLSTLSIPNSHPPAVTLVLLLVWGILKQPFKYFLQFYLICIKQFLAVFYIIKLCLLFIPPLFITYVGRSFVDKHCTLTFYFI